MGMASRTLLGAVDATIHVSSRRTELIHTLGNAVVALPGRDASRVLAEAEADTLVAERSSEKRGLGHAGEFLV